MYATYSLSALESMTVAQLKAVASQISATPNGDGRKKQTWISAILDRQSKLSPAKVEAIDDAWIAPEMPSHAEQEAIEAAAAQEDYEYEQAAEAREYLRFNPDAEGGFFGEYHSCYTVAADTHKAAPKSLASLIEQEFEYEIGQHEAEGDRELPPCPQATKLGAALVVGVLACIVIFAARTLIVGGCAIVQLILAAGSYCWRIFGAYDPDLDIVWQLRQLNSSDRQSVDRSTIFTPSNI